MFVIAHRGANKFAPQNTIEAFRKAAELDSDGVETDVRTTKDGHLILCHNSAVNGTSDGTGKIKNMYLGEIINLDFGSWFGGKFENTAIPTLDDFFRTMKETDMKIINIELKPEKGKENLVGRVISKAEDYGLKDRLMISSFDAGLLIKAKEISPDVKTGYLYPYYGNIVLAKFFDPVYKAMKNRIEFILPQYSYVTRELIQKAHKYGVKVAAWTVNNINLIRRFHEWEMDGVITDYPDIMKNKINSL